MKGGLREEGNLFKKTSVGSKGCYETQKDKKPGESAGLRTKGDLKVN